MPSLVEPSAPLPRLLEESDRHLHKWTVVVPTVRPEKFRTFIQAWNRLFEKHVDRLIVIQDLRGTVPAIEKMLQDCGYGVEFHSHASIGANYIPTGTDMVRSWGIYKAWKNSTEFTLTLDDDVLPHGDIFAVYEEVFDRGAPVSAYFDVGSLTTFDGQLRGYPFKDRHNREVAVQYGGWHGVLDYDAPTQLKGVNEQEWFESVVVPVPKGAAVTGCIMNAAWRTKYAPIMWQLPMLEGRYNRFGDIWAGLFAKKVCDALDVAMVINGAASVRHERASDPQTNMEREAPGIPVNEGLWDSLWTEKGSLEYAYRTVTDSAIEYFQKIDMEYARHFNLARDEWLRLFK
jgi:hypothetical protein